VIAWSSCRWHRCQGTPWGACCSSWSWNNVFTGMTTSLQLGFEPRFNFRI